MSAREIIEWMPSGETESWNPTTLDKLGKYEEFLENALANSPELMMLESRRSGVRGPFAISRQISMQTPSGRGIYPDLVLLAASGHVIVVEVKRFINPELKDRAVIAQIIDYASSFATLTEEQCVQLFGSGDESTWTDCISTLFPNEDALDELADVLFGRMQRGELNLVIACDKIPTGLPDVVSGIASQSALGFELDLVEVVPYVRTLSESAEILLVPSTRLSTEIVSRTAVTVMYQAGDARPSTEVKATSVSDIEASLKLVRSGDQVDARTWTLDEVEDVFRSDCHPVTIKLLQFAKQHSAGGIVIAPGKKQGAVFGFYVDGTKDGEERRRMIFNCVAEWSGINVYLNFAEAIAPKHVAETLRERLNAIFGDVIDDSRREVGLDLDLLDRHFDEFKNTILWFVKAANIER